VDPRPRRLPSVAGAGGQDPRADRAERRLTQSHRDRQAARYAAGGRRAEGLREGLIQDDEPDRAGIGPRRRLLLTVVPDRPTYRDLFRIRSFPRRAPTARLPRTATH